MPCGLQRKLLITIKYVTQQKEAADIESKAVAGAQTAEFEKSTEKFTMAKVAHQVRTRKVEYTPAKCIILATMLRHGVTLDKVKALAYFSTQA